MQEDEKRKCDDDNMNLNATASVRVSRGYNLPLAKLTVSGTINDSINDSNANKIVQRAVIFVVDRSYSMSGERIKMVKNALKPFIEEICCDDNTIIKLVLFDSKVQTVDIPKDRISAGSTIEKKGVVFYLIVFCVLHGSITLFTNNNKKCLQVVELIFMQQQRVWFKKQTIF